MCHKYLCLLLPFMLMFVWLDDTFKKTLILMDLHDILCWYIQEGWTPLSAASHLGHIDVVTLLINAHAHIYKQTKVYQII